MPSNDPVGINKLPAAGGFVPNRRDKQMHDGALKNAPANFQHVERFNDGDKAPASGSFTASLTGGFKKNRPGSVEQYTETQQGG